MKILLWVTVLTLEFTVFSLGVEIQCYDCVHTMGQTYCGNIDATKTGQSVCETDTHNCFTEAAWAGVEITAVTRGCEAAGTMCTEEGKPDGTEATYRKCCETELCNDEELTGWEALVCSPNPCVNGDCTISGEGYSCECDPVYTGTNCETALVCSPNPCVNGDCTISGEGYSCECDPGFTGTNCETATCDPNPCDNGGICSIAGEAHNCTCAPGFVGDYCQNDICSPNPCENQGNCTIDGNTHTCECLPTHTGANCETVLDACSTNPCKNSGNCTVDGTTYKCQCPPAFTGNDCETDVQPPDNGAPGIERFVIIKSILLTLFCIAVLVEVIPQA